MHRTVGTRVTVVMACLFSVSPLAAQTTLASVRRVTTIDSVGTLKPGDMLRLKIWREPDFSGEYLVDENGVVVLPRLGKTVVAGVPAADLKQRLEERYREYLNNPSIEVTPLRRVSILGAVRNPGVYRIEPSVTLGEAVNIAGGPASQSKRNVVELRRGAERRAIDLQKHPEMASLPLASSDQVYVPQQSWFKQNATWVVSTLVGIGGTVAFLVAK